MGFGVLSLDGRLEAREGGGEQPPNEVLHSRALDDLGDGARRLVGHRHVERTRARRGRVCRNGGRLKPDSEDGQFKRLAQCVSVESALECVRPTPVSPSLKTQRNSQQPGRPRKVAAPKFCAPALDSHRSSRLRLRVVETRCRARTYIDGLESHGPCEFFELSPSSESDWKRPRYESFQEGTHGGARRQLLEVLRGPAHRDAAHACRTERTKQPDLRAAEGTVASSSWRRRNEVLFGEGEERMFFSFFFAGQSRRASRWRRASRCRTRPRPARAPTAAFACPGTRVFGTRVEF